MHLTINELLHTCTDSMLFDSDTNIAVLRAKHQDGEVSVTLDVRGSVSVTYKGDTYYQPSEFPEELKNRIKTEGLWDDDDLTVSMNNWFEYTVYRNNESIDGVVCESDISKMTKEELQSEMIEVLKWSLYPEFKTHFLVYEVNYLSYAEVDSCEESDMALFEKKEDAIKEIKRRKNMYEENEKNDFTYEPDASTEYCVVFSDEKNTVSGERNGYFEIRMTELEVQSGRLEVQSGRNNVADGIKLEMQGDEFDVYRKEYNNIVERVLSEKIC